METQIHIGKIIKEKFEQTGRTVTWFAECLHCDRANIYDIYKRSSIDTNLLWNISEILHFNFFSLFNPPT
jgi:plasmid maintenance system antidote protein VapI